MTETQGWKEAIASQLTPLEQLNLDALGETEAIALCKLLLQLVPKPEPQVQIIDDDGDIDEPTVIEAMFG